MKKLILTTSFIICVYTYTGYAQAGAGINTESPDPSTVLDIISCYHDKGLGIPVVTPAQELLMQKPRGGVIWFNPVKGITFMGPDAQFLAPVIESYPEKCWLGPDSFSLVFPARINAGYWLGDEYQQLVALYDSLSIPDFVAENRALIFSQVPWGSCGVSAYALWGGTGMPFYPTTAKQWNLVTRTDSIVSICGDFSTIQFLRDNDVFGIPSASISFGRHDFRNVEGHVINLIALVNYPNIGDTTVTPSDAMYNWGVKRTRDSTWADIAYITQCVLQRTLRDSVFIVKSEDLGICLQDFNCPLAYPCYYDSSRRVVEKSFNTMGCGYKVRAKRDIWDAFGVCDRTTYTGIRDDFGLSGIPFDEPIDILSLLLSIRRIYDGSQNCLFERKLEQVNALKQAFGISSCSGVHPADTIATWPGIASFTAGATSFDEKCLMLLQYAHNHIKLLAPSAIGIIPIDTGWTSAEQAWRRTEWDSTAQDIETAAKYLALFGKESGVDSVGLYYIGDSATTLQVLTVFYNRATDEYIGLDPVRGIVLSDRNGKFLDLRDAGWWIKAQQSIDIWITGVYYNYSFANYLTLDSCDRDSYTTAWIVPQTAVSCRSHVPGVIRIKSARTLEQEFAVTNNVWNHARSYYGDPWTWVTWYDMKRSIACMQRIESLPGLESQMRAIWSTPW